MGWDGGGGREFGLIEMHCGRKGFVKGWHGAEGGGVVRGVWRRGLWKGSWWGRGVGIVVRGCGWWRMMMLMFRSGVSINT